MRALEAAGFDADRMTIEPVSSVTNEVWLADDYVVRVNRQNDHRLRREVALARYLPAELGYPPIIDFGQDLGGDWLIVARVAGQPLSRWWPTMTEEQRRSATDQLAERLVLLHRTPAPELGDIHDAPQLLDRDHDPAAVVRRLRRAIADSRNLPWVDAGLMTDVDRIVADTAWTLAPFDVGTLIHGDLTFENILWDGRQITAMLDFEWARPGPPDLDLDVLLRFVAYPQLHVAEDYEADTRTEDYASVPWWMAERYPELFAGEHVFERVRIYGVAWDVQELLRFPPSGPWYSLHPDHPYQRLIRTVRGVSYLDHLNGNVAIQF